MTTIFYADNTMAVTLDPTYSQSNSQQHPTEIHERFYFPDKMVFAQIHKPGSRKYEEALTELNLLLKQGGSR